MPASCVSVCLSAFFFTSILLGVLLPHPDKMLAGHHKFPKMLAYNAVMSLSKNKR